MAHTTITALDVDLVLPAHHRDRLIHTVAGYTRLRPTDLDIHDALSLLGLRGLEYTVSPPAGDDLPAGTAPDLLLVSSDKPVQPWITQLIYEHPDLFLANDDVHAGDAYVAGAPAKVRFSAAVHSSQIQDQDDLAGSVPFIVYRDNASDSQTVLLVRIDSVSTPGVDNSTTLERTVIAETCDPESWYEPFIAENGC